MDMRDVIAPVIQDRELLEEFADALADRAPEVERDVARLKRAPEDREITADLFRAIHNIKGDAALCKLELGIAITHPIESLLARFRGGEFAFSDLLAELILLAVDRLELAIEAMLHGRTLEHLKLLPMVEDLQALSEAPVDEMEQRCARLIEVVTGFPPVIGHISARAAGVGAGGGSDDAVRADLMFFRSLALQFESRSLLFKGRTMRVLRLAQETNKLGGQTVDPVQLEAAVYMHDVGMMCLPEAVWLKVGHLSPEDRQLMQNHPGFAAGLVQRMPGWSGAARIIAQHHEMPDGAGYPNGLLDADICPGAKILAIVDAFEAVMLKHSHRGRNRSVLRAIAEVNACNRQFSAEWIGPFNQVIRKTIES